MRTTGLARVTIAAPRRRVDVALPEQSLVAELLPSLLRHAGDHLADDGVDHGGWLLRRPDGTALEPHRTLAAHRIRDGEVLHLVERSRDWPELAYDDIVDAIATGAGRTGRAWALRHTRLAGLTLGTVAVSLVLSTVLRAGPPWSDGARWLIGIAVLLVVWGAVTCRALGDSGTGALLGVLAMPFGATGGALALAGSDPLDALELPHLLTASAVVLVTALVGLVGIGDRPDLFCAGLVSAGLGLAGGWLAASLDGLQAAAILAGTLLVFSPLFGPLSVRLGRVPMPVLPRSTADLVRDDPQPPRPAVYQAVARADAALTGLLTGSALTSMVCLVILVRSGRTSALWYAGLLTIGLLLRARLYPSIRHRVPLLAAGLTGAAAFALGPLVGTSMATATLVLLGFAGLVMLIGILVSTRPINPYLGRYAEVLETLLILSVAPVCCAVLGLYGQLRGMGG